MKILWQKVTTRHFARIFHCGIVLWTFFNPETFCYSLIFSTVYYQMSFQIACPKGCIVTLVAFVWLFTTVYFQMSPQIACLRGSKLALIALVWFFSIMFFSNVWPKHFPKKLQSHIGYICKPLVHCVFSSVSSNCLPRWIQSHTGCICLTYVLLISCFYTVFFSSLN